MRYFSYIAEQFFKNSPSGERLFFYGGPWSTSLLIPDVVTEQRLLKKRLWMVRIVLGLLLIGQPVLVVLHPKVFHEPTLFLTYLGIILLLSTIIDRIVFFKELRALERSKQKFDRKFFYSQMAQKDSLLKLILGFTGSLLFVAGGIWMICGKNIVTGSVGSAFFAYTAVEWGYALRLKLKLPSLNSGR